jgi:nitroreductase
MKKPVDSSVQLHPLLHERWSPRSFESSSAISDEDFTAILEAGRWAPSAFNAQPWRFVVAKRGNENFEKMAKTFSGFNAKWAPAASAFILVAAVKTKADGGVNATAEYDCGQAAAYMTLEATHRGFAIHQIEGFDKEQIKREFALAENLAPMAILIIGKQAPADLLSDSTLLEREKAPRVRLPLSEIIIAGEQ